MQNKIRKEKAKERRKRNLRSSLLASATIFGGVALAMIYPQKILGASSQPSSAASSMPAPAEVEQEVSIEVSGIQDFNQYMRVKGVLQTELKGILSFEDRKFAKNQVVFAVRTLLKAAEIKSQVDRMKLDPSGESLFKVLVK